MVGWQIPVCRRLLRVSVCWSGYCSIRSGKGSRWKQLGSYELLTTSVGAGESEGFFVTELLSEIR